MTQPKKFENLEQIYVPKRSFCKFRDQNNTIEQLQV
jgi:hypothetical protein